MLGCGSAALGLALALAPQSAVAQGIQATPTVVSGSANVTSPVANTTRIDVTSPTAAIDWTPLLDASGNALTFLPNGSTADFRGPDANFAVLNRILPTANNNIVVIDGNVLSQFNNAAGGLSTGGFLAFYSPTGILVGPNARFDVGKLLLTTLDTTPASFDNFVAGGYLSLQGQQGSLATITVSPGAQINAAAENSFFAIVGADVEMRGTALVNGSHAYVAGEVVDLRYSNGLFDILVSTGTAASGEVVTLNGTISGPSSNGVGDNHMIYAVARAAQDPISMLLSGNIGFAPAQTAAVVNGEIILAANYNVFGRQVGGGSIGQDIGTVRFTENPLTDVRADITLQDFNASSSVLAISNGRTLATSVNANSSVLGNLMLIGKDTAAIDAAGPRSFIVSGDVLVDARDYGVVGSGLQSLDVLNANGGTAQILARNPNAVVTIGGRAVVTAEAFGGYTFDSGTAGSAQGGTAEIIMNGGQVAITGDTSVRASAFGTNFGGVLVGAQSVGGTARMVASNGGRATLTGNLALLADAFAPQGATFTTSSVSNAFGGTARLAIDGLGAIGIGGSAILSASAVSGAANTAGAGALADAGDASVSVDGNNLLTIDGDLTLLANATGGENRGGTGGLALGGVARAVTTGGGQIGIGGGFNAAAEADGGSGATGGDAFGGIAGANAVTGAITIGDDATAFASARAGNAAFGFGGNGGFARGGNALFQANGAAGQPALVSIAGIADLRADGIGGNGGDSDNQSIAAGRGGDGFGGNASAPNQADPTFRGGAYLLAGGDYGQIQVAGAASLSARGTGGIGGSGFGSGTFVAGRGGDGFGGFTQAGVALLGGPGTAGGGSAAFGDLILDSGGSGGTGGFDGFIDGTGGLGGTGQGGTSSLSVQAGAVTAGFVSVLAFGQGGVGGTGGNGAGGTAQALGSVGGRLNALGLELLAQGTGGFSTIGLGGNGFGGTASFAIDGITATIDGNVRADASGRGGSADADASGDGAGGTAFIASTGTAPGTLTIGGHASVFANGYGGDSFAAFAAGNGQGGLAYIDALGGTTMTLGSAQVAAVGLGGDAQQHEGGDGVGGVVRLLSSGTGSRITIQRNLSRAIASESAAGDAMLNADGIGRDALGGTGVGGTGIGGLVSLFARGGGTIALPADPLNDPDSVGVIAIRARGIGGATAVDFGTGGLGSGGTAEIEIDGAGSRLTTGDAIFTVASRGGSSLDPALNVDGGTSFGGLRTIRVLNGGTLQIGPFGGGSGATGGDGSGTGNGGNAISGRNVMELNGGTLNVTGILSIIDQTTGGNGARGGNATVSGQGGAVEFSATNSTITFTPDGQGTTGLALTSLATGGNGGSGGNAFAAPVRFTLSGTNITNGLLQLQSVATGGTASDPAGSGGNATSDTVFVRVTNAILDSANLLIASTATGGAGGASAGTGGNAVSGPLDILARTATIRLSDINQMLSTARGGNGGAQGGAATAGAVRAALDSSTMTITAGGSQQARLIVQSLGVAGDGNVVGNATAGLAQFAMLNSGLTTGDLTVESGASALAGSAGATGGTASSGRAVVQVQGNSTINTTTLGVFSNAGTSGANTATAGASVLSLAQAGGASPIVRTNQLFMVSDGTGSTNAAGNIAGKVDLSVLGGSVNTGTLFASARGNLSGPQRSQIVADGGSLNVTDSLQGLFRGDLLVRTGAGGIIGSAPTAPTATAIQLQSRGTLEVRGDGTTVGGVGGQSITLLAGRSLLLNGNLSTANGPVMLTANAGGGDPLASPPVSAITMASGTRITAGTGTVTMRLLDGGADPQRVTGAITLASITAGRIDVRNLGTSAGSNISVLANGVLTASGAGRAIDLASLNGEVINLAGDAGLILTGGGHYGIFAATPTGSQIGSFANYARRYNVANAAAYDALNPGGNFAAFRIVPFLTITPAAASRFYGSANPAFTISATGFLPGDGLANLTGAAQFTTLAGLTSNVGQYAVNVSLGTLLSAQGYQFTFAPGVLDVTQRPITVTADNLSRRFGTPNPALTFTVGGQGLVNGDQLTGALATTAGLTTPIGSVPITQGTLAINANYALTFVNGTLKIDPPPVPPGFNNPTTFEPPITIGSQKPPVGDEDENRYGIDFPERHDAALITEDPLLDDPVTSGSDAAVYGDMVPATGGRK